MKLDHWKDIFKLLAMVVIADERVYKEEVDSFVNSVLALKSSIDDDILITRDMAFEWFRGNRDEILELVKTPEFSATALQIIFSMNEFEHRAAVLQAMMTVSMSDNEFHPSEETLIVSTASHWKLKVPEPASVNRRLFKS